MIERFYLKEYLGFKEAELELQKGLIVFSGPSGSGKSVLMNSILSSLGISSCDASLCESSVTWEIDTQSTGIQNSEVNVFRHIKKEKSRYFVNSQSVSKKDMNLISMEYLKHLSLRDFSDFEDEKLLAMLDNMIAKKKPEMAELKERYETIFFEHKKAVKELEKIEQEEREITRLKEFAAFEIKKIEDVNPKISEDEELMEIKKELSRKEKALQSISRANAIFEHEHAVFAALETLDAKSDFFSDAMNELRALLEGAQDRLSELEDIDVEEVLNRIEELSELKRRYGSIEEALEYKEQKSSELQRYENIEIQKGDLDKLCSRLKKELEESAQQISLFRHSETKGFNDALNAYLKELYMPNASVDIEECEYNALGKDRISLRLDSADLQKISAGEFNRLRLAVLALRSESMGGGGVLMLDEIDANLSGEESMSVAKVLKKLSKYFQIFVISHQPQLTSMGDQHFLVYKDSQNSYVKSLQLDERVDEIARIISGESITKEARSFAKELLGLGR